MLNETSFEFGQSQGVFAINPSAKGRRIYYEMPAREQCKGSMGCRINSTQVRIGDMTMPFAEFTMIYSPTDRAIYLRQYKGL